MVRTDFQCIFMGSNQTHIMWLSNQTPSLWETSAYVSFQVLCCFVQIGMVVWFWSVMTSASSAKVSLIWYIYPAALFSFCVIPDHPPPSNILVQFAMRSGRSKAAQSRGGKGTSLGIKSTWGRHMTLWWTGRTWDSSLYNNILAVTSPYLWHSYSFACVRPLLHRPYTWHSLCATSCPIRAPAVASGCVFSKATHIWIICHSPIPCSCPPVRVVTSATLMRRIVHTPRIRLLETIHSFNTLIIIQHLITQLS